MDNRNIDGIITAIIAIAGVMTMLNKSMDTSLISLPLEAYLGIAFTIVFMTGAPVWLACVIAALLFLLIAFAFYKLGSWVYGLVAKLKN